MMKYTNFILSKASGLCFGKRGACAIPHPQKAYRGGEDAFFSHRYGIGVADGVGGYARENIDPAIYTRNVMRYCLNALKSTDIKKGMSSLEALNYGAYMAHKEGSIGGCPATLVTIVEQKKASILNLGDCGTIIVRNGKLLYQSQQQQHSFNCPFQLPTDLPSSGEKQDIEIEVGDIVVCASDGVLDNVEIDDIVHHLTDNKIKSCTEIANDIGSHASANAQDTKYMSPFAKHALAAGYRFRGGKLDDITVLIGMVTEQSYRDDTEEDVELITDLLGIAQRMK